MASPGIMMSRWKRMLVIANWFFHLIHLSLVGFTMTGWLVPRWRKAHLVSLAIVWASWLLLGLYVGHLGYCPLTDWHWQVKRQLGEFLLPPSYIEYLYWQAGGGDVPDKRMANIIAAAMGFVTLLSLGIGLRNRRN